MSVLMFLSVLPLISSADDKDVWDKDAVSYELSGAGSRESPYIINSCADFMLFRAYVKNPKYDGCSYKLTRDLDMAGVTFEPIRGYFSFDGDNHLISNLSVQENDTVNGCGFFGYLNSCRIANLCVSLNSVKGGKEMVGAFVGGAKNCLIDNCYVSCLLIDTAAPQVGGFAGRGGSTYFTNCGAYGIGVGTTGDYAGGFAGVLADNSKVTNCATMVIIATANQYTGGFVGFAKDTKFLRCYCFTIPSSGKSGDPYCRGFAGYRSSGCEYSALSYNSAAPDDPDVSEIDIINGAEYTLSDFYLSGVSGWLIENTYSGDNLFAGLPYHESWLPFYLPFRDIKAGSWYTNPLFYCFKNDYVSGVSYDEFSPNSKLTRAQFVQILAKVAKADLSKVAYKPEFSDIPGGKWYTGAVLWAADNGITGGIGNGQFGPAGYVTREQLVVFLKAYADSKGIDTSELVSLKSYTDAGSVASWAAEAFAWAVKNSIVSGTSDTELSPKNVATRAQIVVIVKAFDKYVKAGK